MDDVSTGASMDIAQVTSLARAMITEWGMSERLGFIRYAGADSREVMIPDKDYSDTTARLIDEETRRLVDEAYNDAASMLNLNWQKVVDVAEALLKHETLSGEEVHQIMRGEPISKPTVAEMLVAQAQKAREAAGLAKPDEAASKTTAGDVPPGVMPA
jgi:cell division protease FtsH